MKKNVNATNNATENVTAENTELLTKRAGEMLNLETAKESVNGLETAISNFLDLAENDELMQVTTSELQGGGKFSTKEYALINAVANRKTLTINNRDAIKITDRIALAIYGNRQFEFTICYELSRITPSMLSEMNFKSIAEYANALFDINRVTAQQYARIGEYFITSDYKVKFPYIPRSFKKGHLLELLPLITLNDNKEADFTKLENAFCVDRVIHDGMSTNAIRKAVKESLNTIDVDATEDKTKGDGVSNEEPDTSIADAKSDSAKSDSASHDNAKFDLQIEVGKALASITDIQNTCKVIMDNGNAINADILNALTALFKAFESMI